MLAVFSNACSSSSSDSSSSSSEDSSSSSNDQKKADSKGSVPATPLPQCLKKTLDGQSVEEQEKKEFSYSCSIAQELRKQTLTISHTPNSAIKLAPTQIAIPDQDTLKGAFTVTGLEINSTIQVSIKVASDTEDFQFAVTKPYIPKISDFKITAISPKVAGANTPVSFEETDSRELVVYNDQLYVFEGGKYFVSSDGSNWTQKTAPTVTHKGKRYTLDLRQSYVVFQDKLWALGGIVNLWSFDGNTWKNHNKDDKAAPASEFGMSVVWDNKIWFITGGARTIYWSSDGLDWTASPVAWIPTVNLNSVAYQNQIFIAGGKSSSARESFDAVYSFDGKSLPKVATLPKKNMAFGLESFAGGLVVVGGGYFDDSGNPVTLNSLWYSPYGIKWHVIATDLTKGDTVDAPTGVIYSMVKWKPKTGSHANTEALWISDNKKIYQITYTGK